MMKAKHTKAPSTVAASCLLAASCLFAGAAADGLAQPQRRPAQRPATTAAKPKPTANEEELKAELDRMVQLAPAERLRPLEEFVRLYPESSSSLRAREVLTSTRAAVGDEMLRTGDRLGGVESFRRAVAEAPPEMSDKLFAEVVVQLPATLFMRGEREAAFELARAVEERAKGNAQRRLAVASFYLSVEHGDEAARVAESVIAESPDLAAAHYVLGSARRVALRLDEAAAAFAHALELDPNMVSARRGLADLRRATGKAEEALELYRQQLAADPSDAHARTGMVLSLYDAGRREEAEKELNAALQEQPNNLPLMVGAAYWYAARGEGEPALDLADKAVSLEPRMRWAWTRVALARALLVLKRPTDAERALMPALETARFPTLDYELASVRLAAGLYDEAAEELARSFVLKDGRIETLLAGRHQAAAPDFIELLAPERRASLMQHAAADSPENARLLKALLAFHGATAASEAGRADAEAASAAGRAFASGEDEMRTFRQLYVAGRLLQRGVALPLVIELSEAAKSGVEAALDSPVAGLALFADEIRELRARAHEQGATTTSPNLPRDLMSKVLRGRIEELSGWAMLARGDAAEATVHLRRAVSVYPEGSNWWRSAQWRLGAALDASGNSKEALAAYVRSYRLAPDPARRAVIEGLYQKVNGSLEGLDKLLSGAQTPAEAADTALATRQGSATVQTARTTVRPTPEPVVTVESASAKPVEASTGATTTEPSASPAPTPDEESRSVGSETGPARVEAPTTATPEVQDRPTPAEAATRENESARVAPANPGAGSSVGARSSRGSSRRGGQLAGPCSVTISEESVTINRGGGSAAVVLSFENYEGTAPPRVNPSTLNWADIIIFAEPRTPDEPNAFKFTINSTSQKTGAFTVNFDTSCGNRKVTVNVR